jgi:outer membrane protein assembly factor BamD (BamD/ComL family)
VRARKRDASSEPTPSLGRERELIEQVHAALAEGDTASARAHLDAHARDYAEGVFVQEREALVAIVDCKAGELARGRTLADEFLRAHPHAVLAARVRRACQLDSPTQIGEGSEPEAP